MSQPAETTWDIQGAGITKRYGRVVALDDAHFDARFGEIHALLGENGAGKSTFVKILSGSVVPDEGTLLLEGEPMHKGSVSDADRAGISTVFQELSLLPDLSVAENLYAGREPRSWSGLVNRRAMKRNAQRLFAELELQGVDPEARLGDLPLAQQQLVEIAKVVARRPRVLILDEATSSLPRADVVWLFDLVRRLRDEGTAVVMISHRMREVFELADRVTVFRNGKTVLAGPIGDFEEDALVEAMLGRTLVETYHDIQPAPPQDEVLLEVEDLRLGTRFRDVSFTLRRGEVLGLGGLQGQGQTELLLSLYGWYHAKGSMRLEGKALHPRSPRDARKAGIALVPEDRRTEGLSLHQSIRENLTLPQLSTGLGRFGWIPRAREVEAAAERSRDLSVKAASIESEVAALSGGNQQKVLLSKCVVGDIRVLLLADVTRGVDVGTKAEIFEYVCRFAAGGGAVIYFSSDATELVTISHRVAVMYDRTLAAVLEGDAISEEAIVRAAVSGRVRAEVSA